MMRKRRIVRNVFIIIGAFILLLVVLAQVFKNDIIKLAITKGAKTFNVPLSVGNVDFTFLHRFPLATIEFNDLVMTGYPDKSDSLLTVQDTIIRIGKLYASVDIGELMDGNILVKKVDIIDADVQYLVDSAGNSNLDFLLKVDADTINQETPDTSVVQGVYTLDKLTLKDVAIDYSDKFMKFDANLFISNVDVKGKYTAGGYSATTTGEVIIQQVDYDDFHLEGLNQSAMKFDLTALNDTIEVRDIQLEAAGAVFDANGYMLRSDSIYANLNVKGEKIDLGKSFNLLSQAIKDSSGIKKLSGVLNVDGNLNGYLTPNSIPEFNFKVDLQEGLTQYEDYPLVQNINLSTTLSNSIANSLQSAIVTVESFHALTGSSKVDFNGVIQNLEKIQYDVNTSVSLNLGELSSYVPDSVGIKMIRGTASLNLTTSGTLPDSITEDFTDYVLNKTTAEMKLSNINFQMDSIPEIRNMSGELSYKAGTISMKGLKVKVPEYKVNLTNGYFKSSYKGKVSNYKNMTLNIDSLLLALDNHTSFSIAGKINGFDDVKYSLRSNVQLSLEEIYPMLPDSLANSLSGMVNASIRSKGDFKIDSIADNAMSLLFENSNFMLDMNNVTLDMPDTLMNVSSLKGSVVYRNDSVFLNDVAGTYAGLYFSADSTYISKVYSAAILNQPKEMRIHGDFGAGDLDFAFIEKFMDDTDTVPIPEEEMQAKIDTKESGEAYEMKFTYKINGKAKLKSFKYGDILVENMDSKFFADVANGKYVADDLKCNVFGGEVSGALKYTMGTDAIMDTVFRDVMDFKLKANALDVSRMIGELREYVEDYNITSDNVKGMLSSNMDGRVVMHNYEPVYDSMMISGNMKLEDGALVGVKALSEMESIPGIGIKNLDDVQFSTLESSIFMYDNQVYIPKTDMFSSSFEASFLGMYSFNGEYDFHVRALVGQILSGKVKRSKEEMKSGFDADDKGRYFVSSYLDGKSKAWFDNKKDRNKMNTIIRLKKRGLQLLFNPGLVSYSTDFK